MPLKSRTVENAGYSLTEMLVVLVIISVLAVTAKPFLEISIQRQKESELRSVLRNVRKALDSFYEDCSSKRFSTLDSSVSENCYPIELQVLVDGIETTEDNETRLKRYLRRIPRDPFLSTDIEPEEHWEIRGYKDDVESSFWDGDDVYDISVTHDRKGLDGSNMNTW